MACQSPWSHGGPDADAVIDDLRAYYFANPEADARWSSIDVVAVISMIPIGKLDKIALGRRFGADESPTHQRLRSNGCEECRRRVGVLAQAHQGGNEAM